MSSLNWAGGRAWKPRGCCRVGASQAEKAGVCGSVHGLSFFKVDYIDVEVAKYELMMTFDEGNNMRDSQLEY